jgi:hypothetical protein
MRNYRKQSFIDRSFDNVFPVVFGLGVVAVVGFFVAVIAANTLSFLDGGEMAREEAANWTKDMGLKGATVSCVNLDSDGDGYVSCTVNNNGQIIPLECARAYSFQSGCRVQKFNVKNFNQ